MTDKEEMLRDDVQAYYANEYAHFQGSVIAQNEFLTADRTMIAQFLSELNIESNIIDFGAGQCQWFGQFKNINHYFAVDVNPDILAKAPKSKKITIYNVDVFEDLPKLHSAISSTQYGLFSFFFSHFLDSTIISLLNSLEMDSIIIIDSFWGKHQKERHFSKELVQIERRTSPSSSILLPKRFFEFADLENIANKTGYSVSEFLSGTYWFVCVLTKAT